MPPVSVRSTNSFSNSAVRPVPGKSRTHGLRLQKMAAASSALRRLPLLSPSSGDNG